MYQGIYSWIDICETISLKNDFQNNDFVKCIFAKLFTLLNEYKRFFKKINAKHLSRGGDVGTRNFTYLNSLTKFQLCWDHHFFWAWTNTNHYQ